MLMRYSGVAVLVLAAAAAWPPALGPLLAAAGFAAALSCVLGARQLTSTLRFGWLAVAAAEFCNGAGNLVILAEARGWGMPPAWLPLVIFSTASTMLVAGVLALVLDPRSRHLRLIALDVLAVTVYAFFAAVVFDLGRFIGAPPDQQGTLLGAIAFLGGVLQFVALGLGAVAWVSQEPGRRTANRLLVVGILVALLGDTDSVTHLPAPSGATSLLWLTSSLLIALAGRTAASTGRRVRSITPIGLMTSASLLGGVCLVLFLVFPEKAVEFRVICIVVVAVALVRQVLIVWSNAELTGSLKRALITDPLTGIANRPRFEQALSERLRGGNSATVMLCDLDRFSWVNDAIGADAADQLFVQVAQRLTGALGRNGKVARTGGDEFAVIMSSRLTPAAQVRLAEVLHHDICGAYRVGSTRFEVSVTTGLTVDRSGSTKAVINAANLALSAAKEQRRGGVWVHDEELERREQARLELIERLRAALSAGELSLVFQPIYSLTDRRLVSAEALLRWHDASEEPVASPREMFELARDGGFVAELDAWAIDAAIAAAGAWTRAGHDVDVNVNVVSYRLADPGFAVWLTRQLEAHRLPASRLIVELTEQSTLDPYGPAAAALRSLCELGVRFSIDDFGTGYSNLNYLSGLPLYGLKIDRVFIAHVDDSRQNQSVTRAIARLAQEFGLVTCAEGVERPEELDYVRELGIDVVQGYFTGRPTAVEELLPVLG